MWMWVNMMTQVTDITMMRMMVVWRILRTIVIFPGEPTEDRGGKRSLQQSGKSNLAVSAVDKQGDDDHDCVDDLDDHDLDDLDDPDDHNDEDLDDLDDHDDDDLGDLDDHDLDDLDDHDLDDLDDHNDDDLDDHDDDLDSHDDNDNAAVHLWTAGRQDRPGPSQQDGRLLPRRRPVWRLGSE